MLTDWSRERDGRVKKVRSDELRERIRRTLASIADSSARNTAAANLSAVSNLT